MKLNYKFPSFYFVETNPKITSVIRRPIAWNKVQKFRWIEGTAWKMNCLHVDEVQ